MIHKRSHKKLKAFLEFLKLSDIRWNESCQLIRNGQTITGSNITDLIKHHISPGKAKQPEGYGEFRNYLGEMNIPSTLMCENGKKMIVKECTSGPPPKWKKKQTRKRLEWIQF